MGGMGSSVPKRHSQTCEEEVASYLRDMLLNAPPVKNAKPSCEKHEKPPAARSPVTPVPVVGSGRRWGRATAQPEKRMAAWRVRRVRHVHGHFCTFGLHPQNVSTLF